MVAVAVAVCLSVPGTAAARAPSRTRFTASPVAVGSWKGNYGREEPTVAINPLDPRNVVAGANDYSYGPDGQEGLGMYNSRDGGRTWRNRGFVDLYAVTHDRSAVAADPSMVFDAKGVVYYTGVISAGAQRGVVFTKSSDGGRTWQRPVLLARGNVSGSSCHSADKEYLAADPRNTTLYLVFTRSEATTCDAPLPVITRSPIALMKSTDGGRTWSAPKPMTQPAGVDALGAYPVVAPDGTLYVAYPQGTQDPGPCPSDRTLLFGHVTWTQLFVATSRDGGRTFRRSRIGGYCEHFYNVSLDTPFVLANSFPKIDVDRSTGDVYLVWPNRDEPFSTLHVARSTNRGRTWRVVGNVSDPGRATYLPALAASDGVLRLLYMSVSQPSQFVAYYRESFDGGRRWTAARELDNGPSCAGCPAPDGGFHGAVGDYWSMAARCGVLIPVWADYRDDSGIPNIYTRVGSYPTREHCGP